MKEKSPQKWGGWVAFGAALAALGWLLYQIAKKPKGEITYYRCPSCRALVKPYTSFCRSCGEELDWEEERDPKPRIRPSVNKSRHFAIKLAGGLLFFSVIMMAICSFIQPQVVNEWRQAIIFFGGYFFGSLHVTFRPPQ